MTGYCFTPEQWETALTELLSAYSTLNDVAQEPNLTVEMAIEAMLAAREKVDGQMAVIRNLQASPKK